MEALLAALTKDGPWCAMVALFIWQTWLREKRLATALDRQATMLGRIAQENTAVIASNTETLREVRKVIEDCPAQVARDETRIIHRTPRPVVPMILTWIMLGILGLMASGCVRLSNAQAKQLAQAQADMNATAAVAQATPNLPPQLQNLINADIARINAALANVPDMPPPEIAAAALVADPVACVTEAKNAAAAAANPPAGGWWVLLADWWKEAVAGGSLIVTLGMLGRFAGQIVKLYPGAAPVVNTLEVLYKFFVSNPVWAVAGPSSEKDIEKHPAVVEAAIRVKASKKAEIAKKAV